MCICEKPSKSLRENELRSGSLWDAAASLCSPVENLGSLRDPQLL